VVSCLYNMSQISVLLNPYTELIMTMQSTTPQDITEKQIVDEAANPERDPNPETKPEQNNHLHKFDDITSKLFRKATEFASDAKERNKFSLDKSWKRGTGGLDDEDRKTLGELYFNANSVFEYGLGESTLVAAHTAVPRYAGVDSDAEWVMQTRNNVVEKYQSDHFRFFFADIGKTGLFGTPDDPTLQKNEYDYQIAPLILELDAFDVYVVDGRYRVACACISFLHAMKYGADMSKVQVAIHDNDQRKRGYAAIKEVADVVVENKKLWVYRLKPETTQEQLFDLWDESFDLVTRRRRRRRNLRVLASNEESPSKFDEIAKILHNKSTSMVKTDRKEFNISTWDKKTRGGLADVEREAVAKLYHEANSVFEYGLGESTSIASHVGVPRYAGVDSDAEWVTFARNKAEMDHFRFFFADIGKTIEWGNPDNTMLKKIPYDYQVAPLLLEDNAFDFYLVDGRYRVACVCVSFLHAMKHGGDMDKVRVGTHDSHRYADTVKDIADLVLESKSLYVYKLKSSTTEEDLYKMWERYSLNKGR